MEASAERPSRSSGRASTRSGASTTPSSRTRSGSAPTTLSLSDGHPETVDGAARVDRDEARLARGEPVPGAPARVGDQPPPAGEESTGRGAQPHLDSREGRAAALL